MLDDKLCKCYVNVAIVYYVTCYKNNTILRKGFLSSAWEQTWEQNHASSQVIDKIVPYIR